MLPVFSLNNVFLIIHLAFVSISDKIPSIQVPTLKSINSLPKLKNRSCDFLGRITCNLFPLHFQQRDDVPKSRNALERRTVDSRQISTISSLVDRDKNSRNTISETTSQLHESQKENFGLYALKYNRSTASKRASRQSLRSSVEIQNHEHFQPCRASSIESSDSLQSEAIDDGGYCEINLSEDSDSEQIKMMRVKSAEFKSNADKSVQNVIVSSRPSAMPPVPPKRLKSKTRQSQPKQQKLYVPSEVSSTDRQLVERSLHSQRNKVATDRRHNQINSINTRNDIGSVKPVVVSLKPKNEKIIKMSSKFEQINVSQNKSELHRIAASNPEIIATATIEKYPQPNLSVRQIETTKRKLHRQSQSSTKSVDIFKPTNQSNAFDDFDEVLQVAAVVAVNRNQNKLQRSNRVTIQNVETNRRSCAFDASKVECDSNANTTKRKENWKISTDSNELTIYSHEKKQLDDLDEEIIV